MAGEVSFDQGLIIIAIACCVLAWIIHNDKDLW